MKLPSPTRFGGVMSDQLVNDIATIWATGYAVKTSTKRTAGASVEQSGQLSTSDRRSFALHGWTRPVAVRIADCASDAADRPARASELAAAALRRKRRGRSRCGWRTLRASLLAGDRLHRRLAVGDDRVEVVGRVVGPLELLQPGTGRIVDLLEERQRCTASGRRPAPWPRPRSAARPCSTGCR